MKLTHKEVDHIKAVINHIYEDARDDYEVEGKPSGHIFISILTLQEIMWRRLPDAPPEPAKPTRPHLTVVEAEPSEGSLPFDDDVGF